MKEQLDRVLDRMYRGEITLGQAGDWLATHGESLVAELTDKDIQIKQLNEDIEGLQFENEMLYEEATAQFEEEI